MAVNQTVCHRVGRFLAARTSVVCQTRNSRIRNLNYQLLKTAQSHYEFSPANLLHKQRIKHWEQQFERYKFSPENVDLVPLETQAASFFIRCGGSVKCSSSPRWFQLDDNKDVTYILLPLETDDDYVEAVDLSGVDIIVHGLEALEALPRLRYLNLSRCRDIDDHALDRLMGVRHSLEYLDISGCIRLTERGISSLHRLRKLRRLRMHGMQHVKEAQLLCVLLMEQLPQLHIDGVDYTDLSQPVQQHTIIPQFIRNMRRFETRMIDKLSFTSRISRWEAYKLRRHAASSTPAKLQAAEFAEYYASLEAAAGKGLGSGDSAVKPAFPVTSSVEKPVTGEHSMYSVNESEVVEKSPVSSEYETLTSDTSEGGLPKREQTA